MDALEREFNIQQDLGTFLSFSSPSASYFLFQTSGSFSGILGNWRTGTVIQSDKALFTSLKTFINI